MNWSGSLVWEAGWLAFTGEVGAAPCHAHSAAQILIVTAGRVELSDAHGERAEIEAALIPARAAHAVQGSGGARAVMLYADADSPLSRCARDLPRDRLASWITAAEPLTGLADRDGLDPRLLSRHAMALLASKPPVCSKTLRAAMELLPDLLPGPLRLAELSAAVGISTSRLGHLFAAELGLSFPAYLRWARLRRAMELARQGANLTDAAHGAGFTDSSHLTRVVHEMFGLAPSQLLHSIRMSDSGSIQAPAGVMARR